MNIRHKSSYISKKWPLEGKEKKYPYLWILSLTTQPSFPLFPSPAGSRSFSTFLQIIISYLFLIFQLSAQYYLLHMDTSNNTQGLWHKRLAVWCSSVFWASFYNKDIPAYTEATIARNLNKGTWLLAFLLLNFSQARQPHPSRATWMQWMFDLHTAAWI